MHSSLKPNFNIAFSIVFFAILSVCIFASSFNFWPPLFVAASLGVGAGLLQIKSIASNTCSFINTSTALEVRKAMLYSIYGKASIALLWVNALIFISWALYLGSSSFVVIFLLGFSSFSFFREITALPALFRLNGANNA